MPLLLTSLLPMRPPPALLLLLPGPAGAHKLVPLYACHLRAGLRHTTYQIFFEQLLAQVGGWFGQRGQAGGLVGRRAGGRLSKVLAACRRAAIWGRLAEFLTAMEVLRGPGTQL